MKKRKNIILILISIILLAIVGYLIVGNPFVYKNNKQLIKSITSVSSDAVIINEVIPFKWDYIYTFDPYTSKENIEGVIGFKSRNIKVNNISEGMVHLIFVKDKKVVASILGYSDNLGFEINFADKISFDENAKFKVEKYNDLIVLSP